MHQINASKVVALDIFYEGGKLIPAFVTFDKRGFGFALERRSPLRKGHA